MARDIEEIRELRREPGKAYIAVGGAVFVSSLMSEGLIDEVRLTVNLIGSSDGQAPV